MCIQYPRKSGEGIGAPETGLTDSWKPPCGCGNRIRLLCTLYHQTISPDLLHLFTCPSVNMTDWCLALLADTQWMPLGSCVSVQLTESPQL